jgi:hypothetical protein
VKYPSYHGVVLERKHNGARVIWRNKFRPVCWINPVTVLHGTDARRKNVGQYTFPARGKRFSKRGCRYFSTAASCFKTYFQETRVLLFKLEVRTSSFLYEIIYRMWGEKRTPKIPGGCRLRKRWSCRYSYSAEGNI